MSVRNCASRVAALAAVVALPLVASAQSGGGNPGGGSNGGTNTGTGAGSSGLINPLNNVNSLPDFLNAILKGVVEIGTIILVMMLVYVGFLFVAARGNAEKIQGAKSALLWTVIGGLVLLGASAIGLVIQGTVKAL